MDPQSRIGAHVSIAGGIEHAPARAAALDAAVAQLFTKQPNRWAEPLPTAETVRAFQRARHEHGLELCAAHDSYLINLATPDPELLERSYTSFRTELERCAALGIELLVTHPGHATDGDRDRGLAQNADRIQRALEAVPGDPVVLLETTAGSGTALGARFEELAAIIDHIDPGLAGRVGVCVDTCHVWAAGYDLRAAYDDVIDDLDRHVGLDRVRLFHLNDSATPGGSRRDRHASIGEGTLGTAPFRRLTRDPRFRDVPMVIETPKGDHAPAEDRRNLALLRALRTAQA